MTPLPLRHTFPAGPLQCNCTCLGDPDTGEAIVIDPGGEAEQILDWLSQNKLTLKVVLHTHAHFDHFLDSGKLREATNAPLKVHQGDAWLWENLEHQLTFLGSNRFGLDVTPVPPPDAWLTDNEAIDVGNCHGGCLHTPGHTPGSMCFWFESMNLLLAGDTLFNGGIGRTDLWGGDSTTIQTSIKQRLYTLPDDVLVIPGHGPTTTIGDEKRHNAFVRAAV